MSFQLNDSSKIDTSNNISYNYSNVPIYLNQVIHTIPNNGYFQIPFVSNSVNVTINTTQQYKSTNLYITPSHNLISDISYSGELIIQHQPLTNGINKLYTCFLLTSDNTITPTSIDSLITTMDSTNSKQVDISLNTNSDQIYYYDKIGNQFIIFTQPIKISNNISSSNLNINLFNTPISYSIIKKNSKNVIEPMEGFSLFEGFSIIEGLTQTAYCQPIEMIDASGAQDANLTIPLKGLYTPNDATNSVTRTAINFMTFVLVLVFTYVMAPIIYNDFIIGLIELTDQSKMNRIRSIDVYMSALFIMATFSLISMGIKKNNPNSTIMGFFLGLFFVIGFVIIQSKKMDSDWESKVFGPNSEALYDRISVSTDFFNFISTNIMVFVKNILYGVFIFGILISFLYLTGSFSKGGILNSGNGIIYVILLTIYLTIAISSVIKK